MHYESLRRLLRHWRLIALCALLSTGAAAAMALNAQPVYQAQTQLFVLTTGSTDTLFNLNEGGQFAEQRVKSYTQVIKSPEVLQPVIDRLHLPLTADQLAAKLSASVPLDTVLIDVSVNDHDPATAQKLANAIGAQFTTFVGHLEKPSNSADAPVRVAVVKKASLPQYPISPRKKFDLAVGLVLGLLVGFGAAALRESTDRTVKSAESLTQAGGAPTLGIVGFDSDARDRPLLVQTDPHSPRAEAFRQLRTNLQFVDVDHAVKSLVITSSVPGEGKSTTSANLAITMAQAGLNVILVEADLRRPRLMSYLGLEGAVGLTSVLIGRAALDDVIQPWGAGQLRVLPAGPTPPNPSELLGSEAMATLLGRLEEAADIVLFDAPPLLPVTDAAVLSKLTDGAVIVARHGKTTTDQISHAQQVLRVVDASVVGLVLNMAPSRGPDAYAYGYGYRYTYRPTSPMDVRPEPSAQRGSIVPTRSRTGASRPGSRIGRGAQRPPAPTRTDAPPAATVPPEPATLSDNRDFERFFTGNDAER